jgi:hypothetical protein
MAEVVCLGVVRVGFVPAHAPTSSSETPMLGIPKSPGGTRAAGPDGRG